MNGGGRIKISEMAAGGESEDDVPALSAETFTALQEFYREQDVRERERTEAVEAAACSSEIDFKSLRFDEDWQMSQFWYDEDTAGAMAAACWRAANEGSGTIACVSAPTLYIALKKLYGDNCKVRLFEHDKRFAKFGSDFAFYDYKSPLEIPRDLRESFDVVFADPPFLSEECLTKTAVTLKYLAKRKIVLCTGAVMEELAGRLLNAKICRFEPRHSNNLANEFRCYANFDFDHCVGEK